MRNFQTKWKNFEPALEWWVCKTTTIFCTDLFVLFMFYHSRLLFFSLYYGIDYEQSSGKITEIPRQKYRRCTVPLFEVKKSHRSSLKTRHVSILIKSATATYFKPNFSTKKKFKVILILERNLNFAGLCWKTNIVSLLYLKYVVSI